MAAKIKKTPSNSLLPSSGHFDFHPGSDSCSGMKRHFVALYLQKAQSLERFVSLSFCTIQQDLDLTFLSCDSNGRSKGRSKKKLQPTHPTSQIEGSKCKIQQVPEREYIQGYDVKGEATKAKGAISQKGDACISSHTAASWERSNRFSTALGKSNLRGKNKNKKNQVYLRNCGWLRTTFTFAPLHLSLLVCLGSHLLM